MTKGKQTFAKRAFAMAVSMSMVAPLAVPAIPAFAETEGIPHLSEQEIRDAKKDEGYSLIWHDEFDGDTLNTEDWNVEQHEPGWVNAELQRYTKLDEGNIEVKDGVLSIYPKAEKKAGGVVDVFDGNGIDDTWSGGGAVVAGGTASIALTNIGENPWDVQFQKAGLTLTQGHQYKFTVKAKAGEERMIALNVGQSYEPWGSFGSNEFIIGTEETECSIEFTMGECLEGGAAAQVNLGNFAARGEGLSALTTVELWDATLIDLTEGSGSSATVIDSFDDSWSGGGAVVADGTASIALTNIGENPWDVQFQKAGLTLVEGHEYEYTVTAEADEERMIALNIGQSYEPWGSFGSNEFVIGTEPTDCTVTFTMGECLEGGAAAQVNLGNFAARGEGLSALTNVRLTRVSLVDLTAQSSGGDEVDVMKDYTYTSGRINTQNKHDFTYGYFEARARVPEGKGYLPAFWLMATDEGNYGQWPKCGEVDIMEVKGQDTSLSYHTIHYGYDVATHKENQVKMQKEEGAFFDDYHVFAVDWEPGLITWYVDGEEVGSTNDWHSGKNEETKLTYPAPFDQDFYVILNLAVGGSWVGYPDQEVVEDMENQSFDIDYVRVYQKAPEVYAAMEAEAVAPVHEATFREADANGNYVVNGTFAEDLKEMDSRDDNFELHLETENKESAYTRSADAIHISQAEVGTVDYSAQLKQGGVPMIKGWEYELSYDAWADEARTMIVEVEGPDNNWTRYFNDTTVELTTKKTTYTHKFTMGHKTDANGSVEFNLGNQGSTATVHIGNVSIKHVGGEEIIDEFQKSVGADGNYVYNGSFDQGDGRLGYWEIEDEDADYVSVTNDFVEGERRRELCVLVEAPAGTSKTNPVVVTQSELAPIAKGQYEFSFDAYSPDAPANGMVAVVGGKEYKPEITAEKNHFAFSYNNKKNLTRNQSYVEFRFTKPGTYYLDNVAVVESAMIKNGSFNSGLAGYETGVYGGGDATFGVDSQKEGNDTALDADIKDSGDADWNIQLKQRGITLKKDSYYKLTYKAKATVDRTIGVVMQRDGAQDGNWNVYSGDNNIDLVSGWTEFELFFQMKNETDTNALLSVALGTIGDRITEVHHVYMDDFELVETDADGNPLEEEAEVITDDWEQLDDGKWVYHDAEGNLVTGWQKIAGKWYVFNKKGVMLTGWRQSDGKWYFMNPKTGAMVTGWRQISRKWYFFNTSGAMATGWKKVKGTYYFFDANGVMATEEFVKSGKKIYWLNKDGSWTDESAYKWTKDAKTGKWWFGNSRWYAINASYKINGKVYNFDKAGWCTNP